MLPCGKGDSIFSSIRKFKKNRTSPLDGREKKESGKGGQAKGIAAESRLRRWIDVSKTRNSLDPGSSRVAVVVHAINQPIDSLRYPTLSCIHGRTFALVVAIPAEKWRRPDAWEIRKDAAGEGRQRPGSDKKFRRARVSAVQIFSLIESTCAGCVFRGKIDYGRIKRARVAKR